ncbi:hypothetical protein TISLANDTSLP1_00910 [Thermodesulfovibrio yellowstonii]|uniref:Uncharacterized protein n=1 Tax=Thermodesulfovibrio yellowstonii TaxID=28262 RepID=A0A9W6LJQ5_9BACT|nr:hypothetical protein TISLANDTSLP1_00910 [Thermodesulfovibrio islandicus]
MILSWKNREKLPENIASELNKLRKDSKLLRCQREISFCGEIDFILTKDYTLTDVKEQFL